MSIQKPRRLIYLAVPLLLAATVVAIAGVGLVRKVATFQPLGFTANALAAGFRIGPQPMPSTGLEAGDHLLLINGQTPSSAGRARELLVGRSTSELEVLRGGELVRVTYHRPPLRLDLLYFLFVASGALYLVIGLYTAVRNTTRSGMLFFLWCLASAVVFLFTPSGRDADLFDRALVLGEDFARLLLGPLTLHLFLVFPARQPSRLERRFIPFSYLPSAVLLALGLDQAGLLGIHLLGAPTLGGLAFLDRLRLVLLVAFALAAVVVLFLRWRSATVLEERRQLRWMMLGLGGGYVPFVALYALPYLFAWSLPSLVAAAAVLPLALVPLTFAWAIMRYKLWDIEVIVRDAVTYTLTGLLGIVSFALLNLLISRGVPDELAQARTLLSFVAGLGIAAVMVPARRTIGTSLARLHYGGAFARRVELGDLAHELLHERDLDHLCASLLDHIASSLEIERVNLYLVEGASLVAVRPHAAAPSRLPADLFEDAQWRAEVNAVSGLAAPGLDRTAMLELYRAGYRYALPLTVRSNRVGMLVASYRLDQMPLSSEDTELARALLDQAALAIENAQLLEELHHRLEEVVALERYNQGIIESSPAGLAVLSADDLVLSSNLAFAALVGRERRSLLGQHVRSLLPLALPPPGTLTESSYLDPSGRERHLQMSLAELGTTGGGQRVLIALDVTERVSLERELKEKERLAALGMLAAGVAHEVNTPITGISSYAQMLLEETPESDPRHLMLKKMERQTFRASRIVTSLLEFARNRRGEQSPVNLAVILADVLEEQKDRLAERAIELELRADRDGLFVLGNETELVQVIVNLVTNAMDAMKGGGRLTVEGTASGERVSVRVIDTGVGIPQDQLDKVFRPFFSTKLGDGGTGLGLSISYEIVRRHGGSMRVVSQPGEGSCFTVELPKLQLSREVAH